MFALIESYKAGLFHKNYWKTNIIAGLIVGIVALPLAMAFAVASGYKPEQGIYTAIIAGLIVGIFGGSRVQISGPTGAFVTILASIGARYGLDGLGVATILAGIILIFMGILRIGTLIQFIPYPVIVGFTSGIGIIIFTGAIKDFFGLSLTIPLDAHFLEKVKLIVNHFATINPYTTILAFISLLCIIITPRLIKHIPGALIAIIIATGLHMIFQWNQVATIGTVFGSLPQTLPSFAMPSISKHVILLLLGPAFTIALLGAIESLLSAASADTIMGIRHDANQELIGQGLANIVAPLFGGFASTGAIARTVTNIRNGGNSPIAAIVHSIFLLGILLFLAPLATQIPLCTLAAILFIVAFNMSDIPEFIHIILHAPWYDIVVLVITFLLTVFTDLVVAVFVGVILAVILFLIRLHFAYKIYHFSWHLKKSILQQKIKTITTGKTLICTLEGPFFFGVTEQLEHAFATTHTDPETIIFNFEHVPFIDMTGLVAFKKVISRFAKRKVAVFFCNANKVVKNKLQTIGITKEYFYDSTHKTIENTKK